MKKVEKNKILTKAWLRVFFLCIGIVLLLWGVSEMRSQKRETIKETINKDIPFNKISDEELYTKLKNVVMTVPDTNTVIQLKNGESDYKVDPEIESLGSVSLSVPYTIRDIFDKSRNNIRTDIISPLTVESGGSGSFQYVELFIWDGEKLIEKSYAFLGDRISINTIKTKDGSGQAEYYVVIDYLVRNDNEPMSDDPTHRRETTIPVVDGRFDPKNTKTINL